MISVIGDNADGTVMNGTPRWLLCIGMRRMVSSQLSSVSVRGRSSTSAMSSKNDSGNFQLFGKEFEIIVVRAFYVDPAVGLPFGLFSEAVFNCRDTFSLFASFQVGTEALQSTSPFVLLVNTIARSWV